MGKSKELLKNTIIIFLGKFSTQFLSFFLIPLYTAFLNKNDYGTIDLIITYITLIVPVFTIEIEMGAFRFLIEARNNESKKNNVIYNSLNLIKKILIFLFVIYFIVMLIIKYKYKYITLICIVGMILNNLLMQIARGLGKNIEYSISCFITGIVNILTNIILIIGCKNGAVSILISSSISNIISSIYLFIALKIKNNLKNGKKDIILQKNIIKYSWPLVPNAVSWWVINASDRTIVSIILGISSNGIYAISTKFSAIINSLLSIFNLSWTESASVHINDKDRDNFFTNINDLVIRFSSTSCICLIAFMPILFKIFVNKQYIEAYKYIPINILASFFSCMVTVYSAIYVAKKMTKQVALTSFFSAIINIIVDLCLIKHIGLFAASVSSCIAYISMTIYRSIDLKKYVNIKYNPKLLISIFVMFIITLYLYYQGNNICNCVNYIVSIMFFLSLNNKYITNLLKGIKNKLDN